MRIVFAGLRLEEPFMSPGFVPQRQLDPIPESQLVVDGAKIIFDYVFGGAHGKGDFAVLQSLGNEFNDALFSLVGDPASVELFSEHN